MHGSCALLRLGLALEDHTIVAPLPAERGDSPGDGRLDGAAAGQGHQSSDDAHGVL